MIEFLGPDWLAYAFAALMGVSLLMYAILDGYDLGVGMLTAQASWHEKDRMIASIGPFWDANETWLIMGLGLLLVAFPKAHGIILGQLYFPVAIMVLGLVFRGVSFDFRSKVPAHQKWRWNKKFYIGSYVTTLAQGYIIGACITSFDHSYSAQVFCLICAYLLTSAYCLIGASWLILKCENNLQTKAITWARRHLFNVFIALVAVSLTSPIISDHIYTQWLSASNILFLSPFPVLALFVMLRLELILARMPYKNDKYCTWPFIYTIMIYILFFCGLAHSFFPYIIPGKLLIKDAAASPESLWVIFLGFLFITPLLLLYTVISYWAFSGKATDLSYD